MASIFLQVLALLAILYILQELHNKFTKKKKKLPPGPKGLPIIGNLHMIGKNIHQDLHKIAKKYGPIMSMKFGAIPIIVASSPHAAEQFLKKHDLIFASRPNNRAMQIVAYNQRNLTFGKYGPYWRNMRKLCTLELLSPLKINSFQDMRKQQVTNFVTFINRAASSHVEVDISANLALLSANMSCLMIFGKEYMDDEFDERGFKDVIQEALIIAGTPNIGEFFPFLDKFDLQGLIPRMKKLAKVFDEFLERVIDEHVQNSKEGKQTKDIVDTMMNIMQSGEAEFEFDRRHVKAILLDLLIASIDTSATSIDWIFSELLRHPNIMKKLQKELEQVVGMNRMVEESDLEKLEYLDMIIKEGFRLHPIAPLLIPRESMEDCIIDGFNIPRGSRILVNTWAIGRDSEVWPEPEKFMPERFVGSDIDLRGHDFQLLPFSSGRRRCPGLQLGLTVVRLVIAQLVHCFDWKLPNDMMPNDLDMTEKFSLVVSRAQHLMAIPTYRLHDLLIASIDTSATSIDWIFSELLRHPNIMKKLQKELEQVVGMNRMVEESDLEKLEYLDMIIKEGFRLHPIAPLLIPRESMEDCIIDGFNIPRGSRILVNTWAIGRDSEVWPEPEKFMPERFVGSDIDLRGHDFQLLPFSSGRRRCPGLQLGLTVVRLVIAQLVHCFDWKLPNDMMPNDLDMTEKFSLVVSRAQHLMAIPTYRLHV